jgi:hypothetical protein
MRLAHLRKETENKKSGRSKRNDRKDTSQILYMGISLPEIRKLILSGTLHERSFLARIHKSVCGRKRIAKIHKFCAQGTPSIVACDLGGEECAD